MHAITAALYIVSVIRLYFINRTYFDFYTHLTLTTVILSHISPPRGRAITLYLFDVGQLLLPASAAVFQLAVSRFRDDGTSDLDLCERPVTSAPFPKATVYNRRRCSMLPLGSGGTLNTTLGCFGAMARPISVSF
eukprot:SAG11_NODE_659_length_7895_cov_18.189969_2_plen_135_part_00